jgi:chromate transport protein ChrA
MGPLELFVVILKASTLSVGGLSSLPVLRKELVESGMISEAQVLAALAVGRLSTGPTGLYVVGLGYFAMGWLGAFIALTAAAVPPVTTAVLASLMSRWLVSPLASGLMRGVALSSAGLTLATAVTLLAPGFSVLSLPPWQLGLAVIAAWLTAGGRMHPAAIITSGAVIGLLLDR